MNIFTKWQLPPVSVKFHEILRDNPIALQWPLQTTLDHFLESNASDKRHSYVIIYQTKRQKSRRLEAG